MSNSCTLSSPTVYLQADNTLTCNSAGPCVLCEAATPASDNNNNVWCFLAARCQAAFCLPLDRCGGTKSAILDRLASEMNSALQLTRQQLIGKPMTAQCYLRRCGSARVCEIRVLPVNLCQFGIEAMTEAGILRTSNVSASHPCSII
jgi:hypothetical protein